MWYNNHVMCVSADADATEKEATANRLPFFHKRSAILRLLLLQFSDQNNQYN